MIVVPIVPPNKGSVFKNFKEHEFKIKNKLKTYARV